MARIKPSALISDIRGSVGGVIFQRFNSGLSARTKCSPVNKRSPNQIISRNIAFLVSQAWLQISQADRDQWQNYTSYNPLFQRNNKSVFISDQQSFMKFNSYRLHYSLPILTVPEFNKCDLTPIVLTLSRVGMNLRVSADRPLVASEEFIILFLTVRLSVTINNPGSKFKLIKFVTTNGVNFTITSEYEDVFGFIPEVGNTLFMKYTNANKKSGLPFPFKTVKVSL